MFDENRIPKFLIVFRYTPLYWLRSGDETDCDVRLDHSPHTYLDGILRFQFSYNSGAFLSIGDNFSPSLRQSIFFWGVAGLLLTSLLCLLFVKRITRPQIIALGLCFAGGTSNLIDRVRFNGAVVDFLNLGVKHLRTGIFNVADMLIVTGAAILATSLFQKTAKPTLPSSWWRKFLNEKYLPVLR